jgi:hypothetical protein
VFDELSASAGLDPEQLADIVRFIPSMEARKRFVAAQTALIGLLVFTIFLKVLAAINAWSEMGDAALPWVFLMPVVNIVLVIGVASHRGLSYRMVLLFTVIGLLNSAAAIFSGPLWAILTDLCLAAALIGLALFLQARLVPDHTLVKERYTNAQGQERLRNTYRFREYDE